MKKFVMILGVLLSSTSFANLSAKSEVLKTAINFGNSVHCYGEPYHQNKPLNSVFGIDESRYAVLQYVDLRCSGGSGTGAWILTPVDYYGSRAVVDIDNYPKGDMFENLNINTKVIKNVSYHLKNKQLSFTHNEYDDKDSNCCPSLMYRTTIDLQNNKVVLHQLLGKKRDF